jgi:c(7)-type cytochrome triheme protein
VRIRQYSSGSDQIESASLKQRGEHMRAIRNWPFLWRLVAGIALIVIVLVGGYSLFASRSRAAPQQPVEFNHQLMVSVGIQCLYCHAAATRSPAAGIPSVEKCMGCHNVIATDQPEVQKLAGYWERQEEIPWVRIYRVPRFVFFDHSVHVNAAELNCERCHGDVGNMVETYAVVDMNMGWCLNCHNQQPRAAELKDCIVCHR